MSKYVYHIENRFGMQFAHAPTVKRCLAEWGSEGFDRCAMFRTDSDGSNRMMVDACGKRDSKMSKPAAPKRQHNPNAHCGNCPYCVESLSVEERGVCGIDSKTLHAGQRLRLNGVCGQHPHFWK